MAIPEHAFKGLSPPEVLDALLEHYERNPKPWVPPSWREPRQAILRTLLSNPITAEQAQALETVSGDLNELQTMIDWLSNHADEPWRQYWKQVQQKRAEERQRAKAKELAARASLTTRAPAAFFSYSREDSDFALRLAKDLKAARANVWLDQLDIVPGQSWDRAVEHALVESTRMLVILSPASVSSTNVMDKVSFALKEGKNIIPVIYRDCSIPLGLRRSHFVDFRQEYGRGLKELLETLASRQRGTVAGVEPAQVATAAPPGRSRGREQRAVALEEVQLGASTPRNVCPGEEFVARFAAYTEAYRGEVDRVILKEAPSAHLRLDLEKCRWRRGAKVVVRLDAKYVEVSNPVQTFKWNGAWCVLRFDARVQDDAPVRTVILRFDVAVEGFPVVAIRPEIAVSKKDKDDKRAINSSLIEQTAPKSAFASYAKRDRRDVLGRVRSLQIFTGIDVFLDCLSMQPGEEWKRKLIKEIQQRDVFWLFWSRSAMASEWVGWEWRTALQEKSISGIQPHPLEPSELAPPPPELSDLQFGAMYEWYVSQLRESRILRFFRLLWCRVSSVTSQK